MVVSDSSRVWPIDAHPLMIRPSKLGSAAEDAAEDTGKAKIRPDDGEDEDDEE
jgi:hypothetical protein